VPDVAGTLARLADAIGNARANIFEIEHDRTFSGAELGETRIELVIETFGFEHVEEVQSKLAQAGFQATIVGKPAP